MSTITTLGARHRQVRKLGPYEVTAIGFGCMNLSHGYGPPQTQETAERVMRRALDLGVTHFDTAALYGFGANEQLVGSILGTRPDNVIVASKCGLFGREGKRVMDGSPEAIRAVCEQSLRSLRTDRIDLYYLHRWEKQIPIEESVGAMADLLRAGKIRAIGLSEVGATTLRRAHAVHPIVALQSEYSLWTRNPEIAVLEECRRIGAAFVAFSPLGRGILTGAMRDPAAFGNGDLRRGMPRFQSPNFEENLRLLEPLTEIAASAGCTRAQLALGWVLARAPHVVAIPGTTHESHLLENCGADAIRLDAATIAHLDQLLPPGRALGARYPHATQVENDTEEIGQGC
jgi:aryl-alcohol dehydrogenase-like predicted oxidoreductase